MAQSINLDFSMTGIRTTPLILFALIFAALLLGCSKKETQPEAPPLLGETQAEAPRATAPAPVAVNHEAFAQLVDQAGEHWRDLAEDVANRVYKAYSDRRDILDKPIFLPEPNNRPFTVAFYHLLRTELVSRGLQVSYFREPNSVILEYSVQTVPFASSRRDGAEVWDEAGHSDSEIIVNARMLYRNRFVMHCSSIRYVNEDDLAMYIDPLNVDPLASSSRNIKITRK